MQYTKLDVVNAGLRVLGERPVNSLDSPHPAVASLLGSLATTLVALNADRWWFNTETITLTPQVGTKHILLSPDLLAVDNTDPTINVTFRGGKLYDLKRGTYEFDNPVELKVHRYVDFDDLPIQARLYVGQTVVLNVQSELDGDGAETRKLSADVARAYNMLSAEHVRAVQANMLQRPGVQFSLWRMHGQSPFAWRNR